MPLMERLYDLENRKVVELVPFWYSSQFVGNVTTGASGVMQSISIQADAHFVVRYLSIMTYVSAVSLPVIPNTGMAALTLNLTDTGSGRQLMDNPQAIQNVSGGVAGAGGNGSLPFILPEPLLLRASGVLQVTFNNLSLITFPRVDISLAGVKVYTFGGGAPISL